MKGWHHESYRHSLSARGIKTKAIIVDIDGTIYDVGKRFHKANKKFKYPTRKFWDAFMDPKEVHTDKMIPGVKKVLESIPAKKIYVSGRRNNLLKATKTKFEKDSIPEGTIILRPKGFETDAWKNHIIKNVKKNHKVLAGIGDEGTDIENYEKNNIPGIQVKTNRRWSDKIVKRLKRLVK